jgi:YidC/Oxa1 family membrane protein insertase
MIDFFHATVYTPLYNLLIGILSIGSWVDVGIAVIVLTLIVKTALFPLSRKASRAQRMMKDLEEPMKEIREKYKDDKEQQGRKMLELYREKGVNPFSSFVVIFIQIPVIFSLYFMFLRGGLPEVNMELMYSFMPTPENVNMMFLGLVDMASRNLPLALVAGVTQFYQSKLAMPELGPRKDNATFQEDFARSMQMQMKFMLPLIVAGFAWWASAAVALYWITSNIFAIGQELHVKREHEQKKEEQPDTA